MPITTIPLNLQVRPISAHWNAPNEAAAQTDKHVDRGGGLSLPLVNRPHPHPLPFFFSCPALCLFGSVHPRSLSWGTYQPEEEERRGGGGAGSSVSSSGEERRERGRKGADGVVGRTPKGRGLSLFFIPPSVQSNSLIYCRSPNWRCEGGCWTGDAERTDAASPRWGCAVGEEEGEEVSLSAIPSERFHQNTHPSLPLLPPPVILQKHLLCRRCGRLPPSLPPSAVPSVPLRAALLRRTVTLSPRLTASSRFLWTLPDVDVRPQVGGSLALKKIKKKQ